MLGGYTSSREIVRPACLTDQPIHEWRTPPNKRDKTCSYEERDDLRAALHDRLVLDLARERNQCQQRITPLRELRTYLVWNIRTARSDLRLLAYDATADTSDLNTSLVLSELVFQYKLKEASLNEFTVQNK